MREEGEMRRHEHSFWLLRKASRNPVKFITSHLLSGVTSHPDLVERLWH